MIPTKKQALKGLALAVAATLLAACSPAGVPSTEAGEPSSSSGQPRLAFVSPAASLDFLAYMAAAARKTGEENGAIVDVTDGKFEIAKNAELITTAVAQGYDAILTTGSDGVIPAVEEANAAGIPVVNFDARINGGEFVAWVGSDHEAMGRQAGEYMREQIGDSQAKILIVGFTVSSTQARMKGFRSAFDGATNVTIDEVMPANMDSVEESQKLMNDVLVRKPKGEIDYIFATGQGPALGSLAAMETAGRNEIKVVSCDSEDGQFDAMRKSSSYLATVAQDPITIGTKSIEAALAGIKGEKQGDVPVPAILVTKDGLDQYTADWAAAKASVEAWK
ncbi:MAG: sugar ABC transporter substrate-binding protein, partial [Propionicimonas sp.]|nr:sugar ABC transporter substrate-binding protein [Propionicimonas sp.]